MNENLQLNQEADIDVRHEALANHVENVRRDTASMLAMLEGDESAGMPFQMYKKEFKTWLNP